MAAVEPKHSLKFFSLEMRLVAYPSWEMEVQLELRGISSLREVLLPVVGVTVGVLLLLEGFPIQQELEMPVMFVWKGYQELLMGVGPISQDEVVMVLAQAQVGTWDWLRDTVQEQVRVEMPP